MKRIYEAPITEVLDPSWKDELMQDPFQNATVQTKITNPDQTEEENGPNYEGTGEGSDIGAKQGRWDLWDWDY